MFFKEKQKSYVLWLLTLFDSIAKTVAHSLFPSGFFLVSDSIAISINFKGSLKRVVDEGDVEVRCEAEDKLDDSM